jgi:hypothetical protein
MSEPGIGPSGIGYRCNCEVQSTDTDGLFYGTRIPINGGGDGFDSMNGRYNKMPPIYDTTSTICDRISLTNVFGVRSDKGHYR